MPSFSDRFHEAASYAIRLHATQLRKATDVPYISHLFGVAGLAMEYGATEDQAIAALLHDAVEDQGGKPTLDEIRRRFGDHVAAIVDGCTDTDQQPKPPWRERKQAYIDHVRHASPDVCLVSACDKLHNSRCILSDVRFEGDAAFRKFTGAKDGTLWYYRSLIDAFSGKIPPRLADELGRVVAELNDCHLVIGQSRRDHLWNPGGTIDKMLRMSKLTPTIPAMMKEKSDAVWALVEPFCRERLSDEYLSTCGRLLGVLARKRPSPLTNGTAAAWAAGIVRTIGYVNFLDDPTQQPHMKMTDIDKAFGVSSGTGQGKSKAIRDILKISPFEPDWTLPGKLADNPMVWMIQVNGFIADARSLPREMQEQAFERGLIPFLPPEKGTT